MKRLHLAFVLAGLFLQSAAQAAQPLLRPEDTGSCQLLRGPVFVSTGSLPLEGCVREIGQRADRYEGSEVRLGFWGQTLIAARAGAVYRSDNGGSSWKPLHAPYNAVALSPSAVGIPPMKSAQAPRTTPEAPSAPVPPPRPVPPPVTVATAPAPAFSSAVVAQRAAPPPPAPRATEPLAPELASGQRSNCQVRQNADWVVQPQRTLAECVAALDRSAVNLAPGVMQRAYWGETYLLADRKTIYRSGDGNDWSRLQDRAGPRP